MLAADQNILPLKQPTDCRLHLNQRAGPASALTKLQVYSEDWKFESAELYCHHYFGV